MKSLFLHALVGGCVALAMPQTPLLAQEQGEIESCWTVPAATNVEVEMFAGVSDGKLEVKFIPKSNREARLLIKNLTKQPLSVRLPDALAARPVLAQARFGAAQRRGASPMANNNPLGNNNNTPQALGVGSPQGNMNRGFGNPNPMNGRNGFFNIAPERLLDVKVEVVCLEHGKKNPRAAIPYQLCRLDEVTSSPGVDAILARLGAGTLDQRASQAAAWHLACGMSWSDLAAKRIEHLNEPSEPYFTEDQLRTAEEAADKARKPAGDAEKSVAVISIGDSQ